jgi:hypothetical protein
MIDLTQFRDLIVRPTLAYLDMYSQAAENLLVGTALVESRLQYLKQVGGGPALGIYQIEPATHRDLYENWLVHRREIRQKVVKLASTEGTYTLGKEYKYIAAAGDTELIGNLPYATAAARLIYRRMPGALPPADDIPALGAYWKQHYNTPRGKGTVDKFVAAYTDRH